MEGIYVVYMRLLISKAVLISQCAGRKRRCTRSLCTRQEVKLMRGKKGTEWLLALPSLYSFCTPFLHQVNIWRFRCRPVLTPAGLDVSGLGLARGVDEISTKMLYAPTVSPLCTRVRRARALLPMNRPAIADSCIRFCDHSRIPGNQKKAQNKFKNSF